MAKKKEIRYSPEYEHVQFSAGGDSIAKKRRAVRSRFWSVFGSCMRHDMTLSLLSHRLDGSAIPQ